MTRLTGSPEAFTYDLASNRLSKAKTVGTATTPDVITYQYDARNRMTDQTNTPSGGTAMVTHETYDANGSQLTDGTNSYTWDLRGRMVSATANGVTSTMAYDSGGQRISETTGNNTTTYLNDPMSPSGNSEVLEEKTTTTPASGGTPTTTLRSFVVGIRSEVQSDATTGTVSLVRDGHGSVRALLTSAGKQLETYDYFSFGDAAVFQHIDPTTGSVTTITMSLAATDQQFGGDSEGDNATGLYYHNARWRNAADGGWKSEDPRGNVLGDMGNANLYSFVAGNPTNLIDPSGRQGLAELMVTSGLQGVWRGSRVVAVNAFRRGAVDGLANVAVQMMIREVMGENLLGSDDGIDLLKDFTVGFASGVASVGVSGAFTTLTRVMQRSGFSTVALFLAGKVGKGAITGIVTQAIDIYGDYKGGKKMSASDVRTRLIIGAGLGALFDVGGEAVARKLEAYSPTIERLVSGSRTELSNVTKKLAKYAGGLGS